jgi:hypothetical protein
MKREIFCEKRKPPFRGSGGLSNKKRGQKSALEPYS